MAEPASATTLDSPADPSNSEPKPLAASQNTVSADGSPPELSKNAPLASSPDGRQASGLPAVIRSEVHHHSRGSSRRHSHRRESASLASGTGGLKVGKSHSSVSQAIREQEQTKLLAANSSVSMPPAAMSATGYENLETELIDRLSKSHVSLKELVEKARQTDPEAFKRAVTITEQSHPTSGKNRYASLPVEVRLGLVCPSVHHGWPMYARADISLFAECTFISFCPPVSSPTGVTCASGPKFCEVGRVTELVPVMGGCALWPHWVAVCFFLYCMSGLSYTWMFVFK